MDGRTTAEYLTRYGDLFADAMSSYDKGNLFLNSNVELLRQLNCPKDWLIDLQSHDFLMVDEADDLCNRGYKSRLYHLFLCLYSRTKWESLPLFISLVRPYNAKVADDLWERFNAVTRLVC